MRKYFYIITIISIVFLVSCNSAIITEDTTLPNISLTPTEENKMIDKALNTYVYHVSSDNPYMKYDSWSEYIANQYNINLQVSLYLVEETKNLLSGDLDGIYAIDITEYFNIDDPSKYFIKFNDVKAINRIKEVFITNHYNSNGDIQTLPYNYKYPQVFTGIN